MANSTNATTAASATADAKEIKESKICLVSANVQLINEKGEKKEVTGYVMASSKFDVINKILAYYAPTDNKVIAIPQVAEAKDIDFIIN